MSDLQFEAVAHDTYQWALPADRLLRILSGPATGDMVRVSITEKMEDRDLDGSDDYLQTLATGELIDETTGELLPVNGSTIKVYHNPGKPLSEMEALEQTITDFAAIVTEEMVFKVMRRKQSMLSRTLL
ncbi:hypothetical protein [Alteromonas confluentis]|uniref:Uncharacterized protein n=1 Tax=Alteromonas confluentis TaxID=1656094 RepID=A0A1E7ZEE7_9ALTE|nr:hypothetical protein [Alteromonas confluentis]OFC71824.1 hypothetical protein BFC18_06625 [Alteromonas confluentis]